MDMRTLLELMREDRLEGCSSNDVDLDVDSDFEIIHIPTLRMAFKNELEGEVDEAQLDEAVNCGQCINNYLLSLDRAVRASKGSLLKKQRDV